MRRHWHEIALYQNRVEFNPDFDYYFRSERNGNLILITARDGDTLVGYMAQIAGFHPHYRTTVWANNDLFWMDPAYREGMTGVKLFIKMEECLRALGAKVNSFVPKDHFERERGGVDKILTRLGYEKVGSQMQKFIGD